VLRGYHLISMTGPVERLKTIKPSGMRRFFAFARDMPDCINLSVGEPDFSLPEHTLKAGFQAAAEGNTHYSPTINIPKLREALSEKAYKDYGLRYDTHDEILVTVGAPRLFRQRFWHG
jgi:aminotransferase